MGKLEEKARSKKLPADIKARKKKLIRDEAKAEGESVAEETREYAEGDKDDK